MENKKNIITIVGQYYPLETGFSNAFQNFQKAIIENNSVNKIFVLAPYYTENPNIDGVEYIRLKKVRGFKVVKGLCMLRVHPKISEYILNLFFNDTLKKIKLIVEQNNIELILIESMFQAWMIPLLKKNFNIPIMVRIHGTGPEATKFIKNRLTGYNRMLLKWVFECKYIAATTSFYFDFFQDYWMDYNHFMDKYFFVVPNTIKCEYIPTKNKDDSFILLQLGRMDDQGYHQKGFTDTIEALYYLEKIIPKEELKRLHYITIGNGKHEAEFLSLSKGLKYINTKHYSSLPNIEVNRLIETAAVILIPSRCEGMSMFATEALAKGKPFIYTTGNGLRDIIIDGYNGIGIRPFDYIGFAKAILSLLNDKEKVNKFAENSRSLYEREFSYPEVSKKFEMALDFIIKNRKG